MRTEEFSPSWKATVRFEKAQLVATTLDGEILAKFGREFHPAQTANQRFGIAQKTFSKITKYGSVFMDKITDRVVEKTLVILRMAEKDLLNGVGHAESMTEDEVEVVWELVATAIQKLDFLLITI